MTSNNKETGETASPAGSLTEESLEDNCMNRTSPRATPSGRFVPVRPSKNIDLHSLSKEELIARVQDLNHRFETFKKSVSSSGDKSRSDRKMGNRRTFDFNKYNTRHVALKVAYLGWDYLGNYTKEFDSFYMPRDCVIYSSHIL